MTKTSPRVLLAFLLLSACGHGTAYIGSQNNQNNQNSAWDAGAANDGSSNAVDAQMPVDANLPQPDAAPPQPDAATGCVALGCQDNAYCDTATENCLCLTGFQEGGGNTCVPIAPGDPAARTRSEMCTRWLAEHQTSAATVWTAGATNCDVGTLSPEAVADGIQYLNLYRFLTGLAPLSDDATLNEAAQSCAILQYRQGYLSHSPPTDSPCYTPEGAAASGSSNLALGAWTPAGAIDVYIDDHGVSSLGHRRWALHPSYGPAGIGHAGNGNCLYVFSWQNTSSVDFVAWPNQGFTPMDVLPGTWSFSANGYSLTTTTEVTVKRVSDQVELPVSASLLASGYALPTLGFSPSGWSPVADQIYEVTVANGGIPEVVYQVKPVSCP